MKVCDRMLIRKVYGQWWTECHFDQCVELDYIWEEADLTFKSAVLTMLWHLHKAHGGAKPQCVR